MAEDARKLRSQETEAKREAAIKEREAKRKAKEEEEKKDDGSQRHLKTNKRDESDTKKKGRQDNKVSPETPPKKSEGAQRKNNDKGDQGKAPKEQSKSTQLKVSTTDDALHSKNSKEATREAAIKERELRRKQKTNDAVESHKAQEDADKISKRKLSPKSASTAPTTAPTSPAIDIQHLEAGAHSQDRPEHSPSQTHYVSGKREIDSAKRLLRNLEMEREKLDTARKRRENEIFKDQFDIDEAELERVRSEEREARLGIMREEAEAQLRLEVAEDIEREELERNRRIEEERTRLLQGGTLEERDVALKKLHEMEEQKFDNHEATRMRAKRNQCRVEEMEKRRLASESPPPIDLEIWQRSKAQRQSILDRISAQEDAQRLEDMLAMEIENAEVPTHVPMQPQDKEGEEAEISKADCIKQRIIFNEHREQMNQEKWKSVLRSQKGWGYPADKDGRLERRRRRWGTKQAMRPEDRVVDSWEAHWQKELEGDALWRQDQRRILEVSTIIRKKKPLADEQLRLVSHGKKELSRLTLLKALGSETLRCHNCDLKLANMQPLIRALQDILWAICSLPTNAKGKLGRDLLPIVANALQNTAHIDPKIAELASCMPKEFQNVTVELSSMFHARMSSNVNEEFESAEQAVVPDVALLPDGKKTRNALSAPVSNSSQDPKNNNSKKEVDSPRPIVEARANASSEQHQEQEAGAKSEAARKAKGGRQSPSGQIGSRATKDEKDDRPSQTGEAPKYDSVEAKREAAIKEREARQRNKDEQHSSVNSDKRNRERDSSPSKPATQDKTTKPSRQNDRDDEKNSIESKREAAIQEKERRHLEKDRHVKSDNASPSKHKPKEISNKAARGAESMDIEAKREAAIKERESRQKQKEKDKLQRG